MAESARRLRCCLEPSLLGPNKNIYIIIEKKTSRENKAYKVILAPYGCGLNARRRRFTKFVCFLFVRLIVVLFACLFVTCVYPRIYFLCIIFCTIVYGADGFLNFVLRWLCWWPHSTRRRFEASGLKHFPDFRAPPNSSIPRVALNVAICISGFLKPNVLPVNAPH